MKKPILYNPPRTARLDNHPVKLYAYYPGGQLIKSGPSAGALTLALYVCDDPYLPGSRITAYPEDLDFDGDS